MLEFRAVDKIPRVVPADPRAIARLGFAVDDLFEEVTPEYQLMARLIHVVERLDRPTNRIDISVQNLDFAFNGPVASVPDQLAMLDSEAFRRFAGPARHVGLMAVSASMRIRARDKADGDALAVQIREMVRQGQIVDFTSLPSSAVAISCRVVAGVTADGWQMDLDRAQGAMKPLAVLFEPGESVPGNNDMLNGLRPLNEQLCNAMLGEPDRFTMDPRAYSERSAAPAMVKRPRNNTAQFSDNLNLIPTPLIEARLLADLRGRG